MRAVEQHGAALSERVVSTFQPLQPVASPWSLVSSLGDALGRTPHLAGFTGGGGRKSARLSLAGHQALAGALQSAFAKHPILAALSSDLRRDAAGACMREVRVKAGAVVAAQGAECEAFAIVGSGVFDGYIAVRGARPAVTRTAPRRVSALSLARRPTLRAPPLPLGSHGRAAPSACFTAVRRPLPASSAVAS